MAQNQTTGLCHWLFSFGGKAFDLAAIFWEAQNFSNLDLLEILEQFGWKSADVDLITPTIQTKN